MTAALIKFPAAIPAYERAVIDKFRQVWPQLRHMTNAELTEHLRRCGWTPLMVTKLRELLERKAGAA